LCAVSYGGLRAWGQRRHRLARQIGILRHDAVYSEAGQWLVDSVPEDSVSFAPIAHKADNDVAVVDHNGQVRNLFPLPWSRTDGDPPNCRLPTVNFAASSARAPLLYRKSSRAWLRALDSCAGQAGLIGRPSRLFEISDHGFGRLLERHCPNFGTPAKWTGDRMPMKRASE